MSKEAFQRFLTIIKRHRVRPILAVVPDNHDPDLAIDDPDPNFWEQMRQLESAGATIAMHGFRHLCSSTSPSMLGLHDRTEFAGVDEETQCEWIRAGLSILRSHRLSPRLFVAPRHGFDRATLRALDREGLGVISDGFATRTYLLGDVICIPQQLWEPVKKPEGLWTICVHSNTASAELEEKLDVFLTENRSQFVSFDEVMKDSPANLGLKERLRADLEIRRIRRRSFRRKRGQSVYRE